MSTRYAVDNTVDTVLVTTAETVVATLSEVSTQRAGQSIDLLGEITMVTGTATTAITLRVRRDSLTGALVGEAPVDSVEAAAGGTETHTVTARDITPGELAGAAYVLTVAQTAATGNGTVSHASLQAELV